MKRQWFTWKGFLEILTHPFIIFAFVFTILFLVVMPIVTVHENQKKYQENVTPSHTIPYHYPTGAQTEQPDASVTLETDAPDETAAENEVDSPVMLESDVPDKAESAVTDTDAVLVNGENNSEVMSFADVQNDAALVGSWEYDEAASKNCENAGYRADVITTFDANGMLYYVNTETYTWTATADTLLIFGEFGRGDMDELEATCSYTISGDTLTLYLNDM
ncbi:MAG: hypothetical protein IJV58_10440, partial [Oscillospiraceae bacterium]|nr:hypothetical protein [Oscillospiraceae bacterium]